MATPLSFEVATEALSATSTMRGQSSAVGSANMMSRVRGRESWHDVNEVFEAKGFKSLSQDIHWSENESKLIKHVDSTVLGQGDGDVGVHIRASVVVSRARTPAKTTATSTPTENIFAWAI